MTAVSKINAQKVIWISLFVSYLFPLTYHFIFGNTQKELEVLNLYPISEYAIFSLVMIMLCYFFLTKIRLFKINLGCIFYRPCRYIGSLYIKFRFFLCLAYIVIGLLNISMNLTLYRYGNIGILQQQHMKILIIIIIVSQIVTIDAFYTMFFSNNRINKKQRKTQNILLFFAMALIVNGVMTVINTGFFFLFNFFPKLFEKFIFPKSFFANFWRYFVIIPFLFLVMIVGFMIKNHRDFTFAEKTDNIHYLLNKVELIIYRFSFDYNSLLMVSSPQKKKYNLDKLEIFNLPFLTSFSRYCDLLYDGDQCEHPQFPNIDRLNYVNINKVVQPRGGASPGLIASFIYVLPPVFAVLACVVYMLLLTRLLSCLLRNRKYSLIGLFMVWQFMGVFFNSPFNTLMIIDPSFLFVIIVLGIYCVFSHKV